MSPLRASLAILCLGLGACAGDEAMRRNRDDLALAAQERGHVTRRLEVLRRLNRVLAHARESDDAGAQQRFWAAFLLAELHAYAAADRPFLPEQDTRREGVGTLGRRESPGSERPSPIAHLVASTYHATRARGLYDRAVEAGRETSEQKVVPDALAELGLDDADTSLQILMTTTYARLGFQHEVEEILARSPELLDLDGCLEFLEDHRVPGRLRAWVCAAVFDQLRASDEREAYRFAVVAVEGRERFGYTLPQPEVERLEAWIVDGASVMFVCPESQTPYVPGQRKSPISGISHLEYVAVER